MKIGLVAIVTLSIAVLLPSVLVVEADAKGPIYDLEYTRGQMTFVIVMPAMVIGGLVLMLAFAKMR